MAWQLFITFAQIGLMSIGGGYAIIPLIGEQVVHKAGWISQQVFTDIITISQMTPGPLAVNTSTFVGIQVAGLWGAVAATTGAVLGGVVIALLLYRFFEKHRQSTYVFEILNALKSASLGLIISAGAAIMLLAFLGTSSFEPHSLMTNMNWVALVSFVLLLFLLRKWKINPMLIMLISGVSGLIFYL